MGGGGGGGGGGVGGGGGGGGGEVDAHMHTMLVTHKLKLEGWEPSGRCLI